MKKLKYQVDLFHKWLDNLSSINEPYLGSHRIDKLYMYSINDPDYIPYDSDHYTIQDFISDVCGFVKSIFNIILQSPYYNQIPNLNTFINKFNPDQFKNFNINKSKDLHTFYTYIEELTSTNTSIALVTIIKTFNDLYQQYKPLPSKDILKSQYLKSKYYWLNIITDHEEFNISDIEDDLDIEFDRSDLI